MGATYPGGIRLNSVLLDTSFLICLSSPSRPHHDIAKQYFQRFIATEVTMHLSTIVVSEYEVRQPISDLGLENFIVLPFNIDDAIATARVFDVMHSARRSGDGRDAVKDDAKLLGQCVVAGITHLATDDEPCAKRIAAARASGIRPVCLNPSACTSPSGKDGSPTGIKAHCSSDA